MVAFTFRMPAGIPGAVNRVNDATVEAQVLSATNYPTTYGVGLAMDAATGTVRLPAAADTAIYGLYVRPYPTHSSQDPLGVSTPPTPPVAGAFGTPVANVLRRGYMTVQLMGATPAVKGAQAYVWIAAAAGGQVPGGITAVNTAGSSLPLPGVFMGPADPTGNTEVALNI